MKGVFSLLMMSFLLIPLHAQVEEVPSGKMSGLFFIDYYHNAIRDQRIEELENTAIGGAKGIHGLQVRRIYLTYDYRFSSNISSRIRLESDETHFTSNESGDRAGKFSLFVKDAYVDWRLFESHKLVVGIQPTPAFTVSEKVWQNRYIEKTIMDLRKIVPSRDLAISLKGNIDANGLFTYWFMYGNNNAGKPENDKHKRYFAQLGVTPIENLSITVYGDYQSTEPFENPENPAQDLSNNIITAAVFAGYRASGLFSCGVEFFHRTIQHGFSDNGNFTDQNGLGLSLFGTYHLNDRFNVFGRFDRFEPNYHVNATGDTRNLVITGLAVTFENNLVISPNTFIEMYENDATGSIKNSVTPRITARWAF